MLLPHEMSMREFWSGAIIPRVALPRPLRQWWLSPVYRIASLDLVRLTLAS